MIGYSALIARCPVLFIIGVILVTAGAAVSIYFFADLPDFDDPIKGFNARGTPIYGKYLSHDNVYNPIYGLSEYPDLQISKEKHSNDIDPPKQETSRKDMQTSGSSRTTNYLECVNTDVINMNYFYMMFEPVNKDNTFLSAGTLKELCRFEDELKTSIYVYHDECRAPSVASLVARMQNTNCSLLTDEDVEVAMDTLKRCSVFYNLILPILPLHTTSNTTTYSQLYNNIVLPELLRYHSSGKMPFRCIEGGLAFTIYYALVDKGFLDKTGNEAFEYLSFGVDVYRGSEYYFYDDKLAGNSLKFDHVKVAGIDSVVKEDVFGDYMIKDAVYFGVAMAIIMVLLFVYLRSIVLAFAAFFNVIFSFVLAYFLYSIVFRFPHFPFINILSALILIAIGADNIFLFFDMWNQVKMESPNNSVASWVSGMMSHAAVSVFVTSFTTASAFYVNLINEVTDIKCFGVFVGTAILCNFILMMTWIPAIFVCIDWCQARCCTKAECCSCYEAMMGYAKKASDFIFSRALPLLITRFWWLMIILFTLLGIGGIVVVFAEPKLRLPSADIFQLLQSDHPIERFDKTVKFQFRISDYLVNEATDGFMVYWVWGIEGKDTGSVIDPDDRGHLIFEDDFDISSPEAQVWMLDFCEDLKSQDFINNMYRQRPCTFHIFNQAMNSTCNGTDLYPCCEQGSPPYDQEIFKKCFPIVTEWMTYEFPWSNLIGKAMFGANNTIQVFRIYMLSTFVLTTSYTQAKIDYDTASDHLELWSKTAPKGLAKGWFTGYGRFHIYDLQNSLFEGTLSAFGMALAFSITILFLMTLNVLITIYAVISIAFTISVTIAILVLIGWQLNVVESIIICIAVGLSIDFTIHYGVAYKISQHHDRKSRVEESFRRVGASVAMAALTTFVAGLTVLPAHAYAYYQFGVFLMIVMAISWSYSTFFFQSLCRIIGPNGNFTQLNFSCKMCKGAYELTDQISKEKPEVMTSDENPLDIHEQNILRNSKRYNSNKEKEESNVHEMETTDAHQNSEGEVNPAFVTDSNMSFDTTDRLTPVEDCKAEHGRTDLPYTGVTEL